MSEKHGEENYLRETEERVKHTFVTLVKMCLHLKKLSEIRMFFFSIHHKNMIFKIKEKSNLFNECDRVTTVTLLETRLIISIKLHCHHKSTKSIRTKTQN